WSGAPIAAISPGGLPAGAAVVGPPCACFAGCLFCRALVLSGESDGRPQKESFTHEAWAASLGGRSDGPTLRRGQGYRRTPPPAPHRPEVWQISRASDP